MPHLVEGCPTCRLTWQEAERELASGLVPDGQHESPLEQRVRELQTSQSPRAERLLKRSLRELLSAPAEHRIARIEGATRWYRSPLAALSLLERAREAMPEEPSEAEHFARLAWAVAKKHQESVRLGLEALACAHVANAVRARGDVAGAEHLMARARRRLDEAQSVDPLILAEIDLFEGVLRQNQNRFEEAAWLLTGAISRYRRYGRRQKLVESLMALANVQVFEGDPCRALETLQEAILLIDREREPKLYLYARHNMVFYLCDAGEHAEARRVFEDNRRLYGPSPERWMRLRVAWLEGKIARAHGEFPDAERLFRQVVAGFARAGTGYDSALASLDLAELYLASGQPGKLRAMVQGVEVILRSKELHREATGAVVLFKKALADELVSRNLLEHVRAYLESVRANPSLHFEPSPS
ncbi:MAG TPA: hypothetical protein VHQ65_07230 [Thermoanaerobaculia bacterium]|nr:hypothetical protein [Thermoanaerobaculia bacterium]